MHTVTIVTSEDILQFQKETWKTFCCQDQVYLEVNLLGHWRVRQKADVLGEFYDALALSDASKLYIETLSSIIPHYKIAVEFV